MTIEKKSFALLTEEEKEILTNTTTQLNIIISINNGKTIKWKNNKRVINEQNINNYIKRYYDPLEFGHPDVNSITTILRKNCYFKNMQARV